VDRSSDEFILLLTQAQPTIHACIFALLPDRVAAQDLLQETNLTLWHKANDFEIGTIFNAWATRIARYHVLNYRRKINHERRLFDDAMLEALHESLEHMPLEADSRFLLVQISVTNESGPVEFPGQFVDNVQLKLTTTLSKHRRSIAAN
jgi:RNA polymerase sigma factor (sigma-70 family)